ncbi:MAG: ornithine cyclodeaminase [Bacteroidota bacterium]
MQYFSAEQIARQIPMARAIELMREAFSQISDRSARVPVRTHVHMPESEAQALFMPVSLARSQSFGLKLVGINDRNLERGLPYIHAQIILADAQTGQLQAVMEGGYITALRTGAASGLATDLLALPQADSLAIFGAGRQAWPQVHAVSVVRPLKKVWVVNRNPERGERLCKHIEKKLQIEASPAKAREALAQASIVCTATTSSEPLFPPEWVQPGTHINAIGAYRPDMAELPLALLKQAHLYLDETKAAWTEAGLLIQARKAGIITARTPKGELGEILLGRIAGRTSEGTITVFKSVGNAAQDLIVAEEMVRLHEPQP